MYLQREAKYLEKVQKKTEKELKQMLLYEMKRAAKETEQHKREEMQLQKDEQRRRSKERECRLKLEKNFKMMEAITKKKEEEEEKLRRSMARQFEESVRLAKAHEEQKARERKENIEKAKQRAAKTEEKRKATEAIFRKQRNDVLARDALARKRDEERVKKVQEIAARRNLEYKVRRDKAKMRISEAQRVAEGIIKMKRKKFEEKEESARLRREIMEEENSIKREKRKMELEEETKHRIELKAEIDKKADERAAEIKRKEDEINKRLTARGLLSGPVDRMKKEDEEAKREILAELESTKEIEARRIRRLLKEEEVETNMRRKMAGDEYKREKIMTKMVEDEKKLLVAKAGRAEIQRKKEKATNDALMEKHRVQEVARKALDNQAIGDLLKNGASIDEASGMLGKLLGWGGAPKEESKRKVKKIVRATKQDGVPRVATAQTAKKKKKNRAIKSAPGGSTRDYPETIATGSSIFPKIPESSVGMQQPARFTVPADPYHEVEAIRKRQNAELLQILQEEQVLEEQRERKLKELKDEGLETNAMQGIQERFARERNEASNRMLRYTRQHEEVLALALKTAREQAEIARSNGIITSN